MTETLIKADGVVCITCAARTPTNEDSVCQPWKLGASNSRRNGRVLGRNHQSGTTMRPLMCPHPESKVQTTPSTQVLLKKLLRK